MKNSFIKTSITLFITLLFLSAKSQNWQWALQEKCNAESLCSATDIYGNLYHGVSINGGITSTVGTIAFTTYTTGTNPYNGCFIKYDSNGNVNWLKYYPSSSIIGITTDNNGDIYVTGSFGGTLTVGTNTLVSLGLSDIFIFKYNNSGNLLWAKSSGGSGYDSGQSITIDATGKCIVLASTTSSLLSYGSNALNGTGAYEYAIMKLDPFGNYIWGTISTGLGGYGVSVCTNNLNDIFIAGNFSSSTVSIGTTTLQNMGNADIFVAKFNANGLPQWALSVKSASIDEAYSLKSDLAGNLYLTGCYLGSTFSLNAVTTLTNGGGYDGFISKFDGNGVLQWAKKYGGVGMEFAYCTAPYNGGVFVAGGFLSNTLTVGGSTFTSPNSGDNLFILDYDNSGNLLSSFYLNSGGDDKMTIATDQSKCNLYIFSESYVSPTYIGPYTFTHTPGEFLTLAKYNFQPSPTLSISAFGNLCSNESNTLVVSGAISYTWMGGSTSNNLILAPGIGGLQTVVGTSSIGCTSTASITLTLVPPPTLTISSNKSQLCLNQSAMLTVSGANSYTWSTLAQTATIQITPSITTVYSVTGIGNNGCSSNNTIMVKVNTCEGIMTQINNDLIKLYPNPNNGLLKIQSVCDKAFLLVYDPAGKLIYSRILENGINYVQLPLGEGIYLYSLTNEFECINKGKLIIQP